MSTIKFKEVLRCSSEDDGSPAHNLFNGCRWLNSRKEPSSTIEVEILLQKEAVITFVDIGNEGSQFVDILVGHSTRTKDEYFTLLPTFTFMSVPECKQGVNRRKVLMFKKDDMMANVREKSWDKLKIVCRQTYSKDTQYGLSFISLRTSNTSPISPNPSKIQRFANQKALNSLFGLTENTRKDSSAKKSLPAPNNSPSSLHRNIEQQRHQVPLSPRVSQLQNESEFINEVSCFLEEQDDQILLHPELRVSDVREQLEEDRGKVLTKTEKKILLKILSKKKLELNKKISSNNNLEGVQDTKPSSSSTTPATTTTTTTPAATTITLGNEIQCDKCGVGFPSDIASIHAKICTVTPKQQQRSNRTIMCLDLSFSDDEKSSVNTPTRNTKRSGSYKLPSREFSANRRKSSGSYSESMKRLKEDSDLEIENTDVVQPAEKKKHFEKSKTLNSKMGDQALAKTPTSVGNVRKPQKGQSGPTWKDSRLINPVTDNDYSASNNRTSRVSGTDRSKARLFPSESTTNKTPIIVGDESTNSYQTHSMNPVNDKQIECPLCSRKFNTDEIQSHAAFCDGNTPVIDVLDNCGSSVQDEQMEENPKTQECPLCNERISIYSIGIHASLCSISKNKKEAAPMPSTTPKVDVNKHHSVQMSSGSCSSKSTCPICSNEYDVSYIDMHVNMCLDATA